MELISQGAEAKIYKATGKILKDRIKKTYRIKEIDDRLRQVRTRREAKVLEKLSSIKFPAPRLIKTDDKEKIEMDFISGKKVKEVLISDNAKEIGKAIGKMVASLHNQDIIHGDLTTSNMIMHEGKIFFIDFGLSFFSKKIEDKSVDLHLLRQALESKHHKIWQECYKGVVTSYKIIAKDSKLIINRLDQVESRGRNKGK